MTASCTVDVTNYWFTFQWNSERLPKGWASIFKHNMPFHTLLYNPLKFSTAICLLKSRGESGFYNKKQKNGDANEIFHSKKAGGHRWEFVVQLASPISGFYG